MRRHTDYENMVSAYDGLSPAERKEMDRHLAECPACAADLAAFRRMDGEIRAARMLKPSAGLRVRFSEAISGASAPSAAAKPTDRVRLAPPAPKIVVRRPASGVPGGRAARFVLPVGAGVLLFVLAVFVSLQLDAGRRQEVDSPEVAAPPAQALITELQFHCEDIMDPAGLSRVIADFEAQNPDIKVKYAPVRESNSGTGSTGAEAYSAALWEAARKYDVYCGGPTGAEDQKGSAIDLAPFIAEDPFFRPEDFYTGLPVRLGQNGPILSVPTYIAPIMIAYDPAAFDQTGVAHPRPGWTWDDFLEAASRLTVREGDQVTRWGYYEVGGALFTSRLTSFWAAQGGQSPAPDTLRAALKWYQALYVTERAAPLPGPLVGGAPAGPDVSDSNESLRPGQAAMWDSGSMALNAKGYRLAPYPEPNLGQQAMTLSGLVMSGQTSHRQEAWRWISYLSQHLPESAPQLGWHHVVPARRSLVDTAGFWSTLDPDSASAYRYALGQLAPLMQAPLSDYQPYLNAAIAVAKGEKTVDEALAGSASETKTQIATPAPAQPAPPTPPAGATVITFGCWRERLPVYEPAVAVFQDENPGVYVELKALEDLGVTGEDASLRPQVIAQVAARVDTLCDDSLPVKIKTGEAEAALRDLSPFIAADAAFDAADFYPGTLEMLQSGAQTWGIPRSLLLQMIYYNQYAFDQAGVTYPVPGWTWDDFMRTAEKLTQTREDGSTRWGFTETWPSQFGLLRGQGLTLDSGGLAELTKPETEAAVQWYVDLVKARRVMPVPAAYTGAAPAGGLDPARNPWANAAMLSAPANGVVADSGKVAGVAPFPLGRNSRTSPLEQIVDAIAMSAGTQHPEESWRWLSVASRSAGYPERMIPARRSNFEASTAVDGVDPAVRDTYRYALEHLALPLDLQPATTQALREAIRTAMVDGVPVEEALRKASGQ